MCIRLQPSGLCYTLTNQYDVLSGNDPKVGGFVRFRHGVSNLDSVASSVKTVLVGDLLQLDSLIAKRGHFISSEVAKLCTVKLRAPKL